MVRGVGIHKNDQISVMTHEQEDILTEWISLAGLPELYKYGPADPDPYQISKDRADRELNKCRPQHYIRPNNIWGPR